MTPPQTNIFIIHAPEDAPICERLVAHMAPFRQSHLFLIHTSQQVPPGVAHEEFILYRLDVADVVIILVSADFLSSDQCRYYYDLACVRNERRDTVVIPVIARSCLWQHHSMMRFQVLPTSGQAIQRSNEQPSEELLTDTVRKIGTIVDRRANRPSSDNGLRFYYEPPPDEGSTIPVVPAVSPPLKIVSAKHRHEGPFPVWDFTLANRSGRSQIITCLNYDIVHCSRHRSAPQTRVLHPLVVWDIGLPCGTGRFSHIPDAPALIADEDAATISLRFYRREEEGIVSPRDFAEYVLRLRFITDLDLVAASDRVYL